MSTFSGAAFAAGMKRLDANSREMFLRHGKTTGGRWALVETLIDDAMLRIVGAGFGEDPRPMDKLI